MLVLLALAGAVWNVVTVSLRQALVPDRLLGRVNSAHRLISWGALPLGPVVGGLLAKAMGLRAPFLLGAAVLGLTSVAAFVTVGRSAAGRAAS